MSSRKASSLSRKWKQARQSCVSSKMGQLELRGKCERGDWCWLTGQWVLVHSGRGRGTYIWAANACFSPKFLDSVLFCEFRRGTCFDHCLLPMRCTISPLPRPGPRTSLPTSRVSLWLCTAPLGWARLLWLSLGVLTVELWSGWQIYGPNGKILRHNS